MHLENQQCTYRRLFIVGTYIEFYVCYQNNTRFIKNLDFILENEKLFSLKLNLKF